MILANFLALLNRQCRQFLPTSCFKCLASTASTSRCRRSPCNYNRPLKHHFTPKRIKKCSSATSVERPGADLVAIWRRKRSKDVFSSIWGRFLVDFGIPRYQKCFRCKQSYLNFDPNFDPQSWSNVDPGFVPNSSTFDPNFDPRLIKILRNSIRISIYVWSKFIEIRTTCCFSNVLGVLLSSAFVICGRLW